MLAGTICGYIIRQDIQDDYHFDTPMKMSINVLTVTSLTVWRIPSLYHTRNLSRHITFHSSVVYCFWQGNMNVNVAFNMMSIMRDEKGAQPCLPCLVHCITTSLLL